MAPWNVPKNISHKIKFVKCAIQSTLFVFKALVNSPIAGWDWSVNKVADDSTLLC